MTSDQLPEKFCSGTIMLSACVIPSQMARVSMQNSARTSFNGVRWSTDSVIRWVPCSTVTRLGSCASEIGAKRAPPMNMHHNLAQSSLIHMITSIPVQVYRLRRTTVPKLHRQTTATLNNCANEYYRFLEGSDCGNEYLMMLASCMFTCQVHGLTTAGRRRISKPSPAVDLPAILGNG